MEPAQTTSHALKRSFVVKGRATIEWDVVECECGWSSKMHLTYDAAQKELAQHIATQDKGEIPY